MARPIFHKADYTILLETIKAVYTVRVNIRDPRMTSFRAFSFNHRFDPFIEDVKLNDKFIGDGIEAQKY